MLGAISAPRGGAGVNTVYVFDATGKDILMRSWLAGMLLIAAVAVTGANGAVADWRDHIKVLRIGIVVGDNPRLRLKQIEPFRQRLETEINLPVEVLPMADFNMLIDAHTSARIDYAMYSASAFAAASALCECLEPIAAPRAHDGTLGYHAIFVVHGDSQTKNLEQLKGKTIVLARPGSTAGHLLPMAELRTAGIDPLSFFSGIRHAPGPKAAVKTVLAGLADVGVAWSSLEGEAKAGYGRGTLRDLVAAKEISMTDIRVIWQSRRITHGPHAVHRRLPKPLKDQLRSALIRLKDLDAGAYDAVEGSFGGGFAEISSVDYAPLTDVFKPGPAGRDAAADPQ